MNPITSSPETIKLIARVLGARETPVTELAAVIAAIHRGVNEIRPVAEPAVPHIQAAPIEQEEAPREVRARKKYAPRRPKMVSASQAIEATSDPIETPRIEVERPASRLLRRADVLAHDLEHHHDAAPHIAAGSRLHGVVKWFDSRTSKGALRLAGISSDVPLNSDVLASSGIHRLYKDQEIEATVEQNDGRTKLLTLSLPARGANRGPLDRIGGLSIATSSLMPNRQPKEVTVHIRHDLSRQQQARAAAEHLLGPVDVSKTSR